MLGESAQARQSVRNSAPAQSLHLVPFWRVPQCRHVDRLAARSVTLSALRSGELPDLLLALHPLVKSAFRLSALAHKADHPKEVILEAGDE